MFRVVHLSQLRFSSALSKPLFTSFTPGFCTKPTEEEVKLSQEESDEEIYHEMVRNFESDSKERGIWTTPNQFKDNKEQYTYYTFHESSLLHEKCAKYVEMEEDFANKYIEWEKAKIAEAFERSQEEQNTVNAQTLSDYEKLYEIVLDDEFNAWKNQELSRVEFSEFELKRLKLLYLSTMSPSTVYSCFDVLNDYSMDKYPMFAPDRSINVLDLSCGTGFLGWGLQRNIDWFKTGNFTPEQQKSIEWMSNVNLYGAHINENFIDYGKEFGYDTYYSEQFIGDYLDANFLEDVRSEVKSGFDLIIGLNVAFKVPMCGNMGPNGIRQIMEILLNENDTSYVMFSSAMNEPIFIQYMSCEYVLREFIKENGIKKENYCIHNSQNNEMMKSKSDWDPSHILSVLYKKN